MCWVHVFLQISIAELHTPFCSCFLLFVLSVLKNHQNCLCTRGFISSVTMFSCYQLGNLINNLVFVLLVIQQAWKFSGISQQEKKSQSLISYICMHPRRHRGLIVRVKWSKQSSEIGGKQKFLRTAILMICLCWKVVAVHWLFRYSNTLNLYPPVQVYYVEKMSCELTFWLLWNKKIVKDSLSRSFIYCGHFKTMHFSVVWNVTCKCYATADKRGSWLLFWYRRRCILPRHAMRSNFEIHYFAWKNPR